MFRFNHDHGVDAPILNKRQDLPGHPQSAEHPHRCYHQTFTHAAFNSRKNAKCTG